MADKWMVLEIGEYTFKKYPSENTGTVNIYHDGEEVDMFTDYSIGTDFEKFEKSCQETYNDMMKR